MDPVNVLIRLQNIHCYDEGDGLGDAEPYLWTVFFKIDGDTAFVDENLTLQGTATVIGTPGNHGNLLNTDVGAGDDIYIPVRVGEYRTVLTPIPLRNPILGVENVGGMIGCVVVLMEEDNTPNSAIAAGHEALNSAVQNSLNDLIPTLNFAHQEPTEEEIEQITNKISSEVENAIEDNVSIWNWLGGFGNQDDKIGSAIFKFNQGALEDAGSAGISLYERWRNEGDWDIRGVIIASPITEPLISFSNTSISFGLVPVGDIRTRTLQIRNEGQVNLSVSFPASTSRPFLWSNFAAVISPGDKRDAILEFAPTSDGRAVETLLVQSNAPGSPHSITLSGKGTTELEPL